MAPFKEEEIFIQDEEQIDGNKWWTFLVIENVGEMLTSSHFLGIWLFQPPLTLGTWVLMLELEDPLEFSSNPSEEGDVDVEAYLPRDLEGSKTQQDQEHEVLPSQIQVLFSFPNYQ